MGPDGSGPRHRPCSEKPRARRPGLADPRRTPLMVSRCLARHAQQGPRTLACDGLAGTIAQRLLQIAFFSHPFDRSPWGGHQPGGRREFEACPGAGLKGGAMTRRGMTPAVQKWGHHAPLRPKSGDGIRRRWPGCARDAGCTAPFRNPSRRIPGDGVLAKPG